MRNPFLRDEQSGSFLPSDYVNRKAEMRANLICLGLFGVVMFAVVSAFFVTNRQWLQVRSAQKSITVQYTQEAAKIEQLKRLEQQKSEMMTKAEVTTALIEKVPRSILLAELITRMPADLTLLELQLVSKRIKEAPAGKPGAGPAGGSGIKNLSGRPAGAQAGKAGPEAKPEDAEKVTPPKFDFTLRLQGVGRSNQNIADYLQSLKQCTLLETVDLKYIKETTIDKMDLRKFEIEITLKKDADARGIAPIENLTSAGAPGESPTKPMVVAPTPGGKSASAEPRRKE
ncbi:MAG: PilN domain-containing protein [Phycisphaerae bacterium]|nr:PilN domain-containing protein [Phycisphaerae bacterium]